MLEKEYAHGPGEDRLIKNQGGIPGSLAPATHVSISHNHIFLKDDAQPLFKLNSISFPHKMPQRIRADLRQFVSVSSVSSSVDLHKPKKVCSS